MKLEVSTHSGSIDIIEVEEYSAEEMATKLNDNQIQAIAIGNNVYSRIDIKNIILLEEVEDVPIEEPTE